MIQWAVGGDLLAFAHRTHKIEAATLWNGICTNVNTPI